MTLTCDQIEVRLSDYLDGLLQGSERIAFAEHLAKCPECALLASTLHNLLNEMHSMDEVEAPPHLVYSILDRTLGPRLTPWQVLIKTLRGFATPKFAYGAASVMATLIILLSGSGFSFRKPKLADLRPAVIYQNANRQAHLALAHGRKYVSDLRVVYEIQSRLRQDENSLQTTPEEVLPKAPGQTDDHKPSQPRQQNRADELRRELELLATEVPVIAEGSVR